MKGMLQKFVLIFVYHNFTCIKLLHKILYLCLSFLDYFYIVVIVLIEEL